MKSDKGYDYGLTAIRTPVGRGRWSVQENSKAYVYQKLPGRPDAKDIRSWPERAFARNYCDIRVCGRYPSYWIEQT